MPKRKTQREHRYFCVFVTYSDGETSGHKVFKDRAKAERYAERQRRSGIVKKTVLEPFVRDANAAEKVRTGPKRR
jgi:hypothetical protein